MSRCRLRRDHGGGTRGGNRAPRPEAGQHSVDGRGAGQDFGLRTGQAGDEGGCGRRDADGDRGEHESRNRPGHGGLHEPRASARWGSGPAIGPVFAGADFVRTGVGEAGVRARIGGADDGGDHRGRRGFRSAWGDSAGLPVDRGALPGEGRAGPVRFDEKICTATWNNFSGGRANGASRPRVRRRRCRSGVRDGCRRQSQARWRSWRRAGGWREPGRPARRPDTRSLRWDVGAAASTTPAWSPDGKVLAYSRESGGYYQIFTWRMDQRSEVPAQLTTGSRDCLFPFWHPSGDRVYFLADNSLWSVGAAGGQAERVIEEVRSAAISPDGKTLVFSRNERGVGLWTATAEGKNPARRLDLPDDGAGYGRGAPVLAGRPKGGRYRSNKPPPDDDSVANAGRP